MAITALSPGSGVDQAHSRMVTQQWAELFERTPFASLSPEVVGMARRALLDFLGVALGGASMPMPQTTTDYYRDLGGKAEASLVGLPDRLPGVNAALVNGVMGHALDMDDGHRAAGGHPGVVTIPAALAAAEMSGASGLDLLRAIVFGYEVFVRIGSAINPGHLNRGFHTTATVGPFAAAAAAGVLRGLSTEQMVGALGLAGVQGAGLMEVFHDGAMAKPFQTARASSAGLLAVELAARGASGPSSILEGEQGFIAALCGGEARLERLTDGLGQDWRILGAYFKEHAACRHSHAAIDGCARMRSEGLKPEDVERVLVRTYKVAYRLCADDGKPKGISEAKFSLPYTVALALTHGHGRQSGFSLERIADPELLALAARVRVEVDPEIERLYPERRAAILEVTTKDGRTLTADVPMARGEPEIPLSDAEIEGKFLDNASAVFPVDRARAIAEAVKSLDSQASIAPLMDLVSGR